MRAVLYTSPAEEPVTTAEAKTHLRVTTAVEDTFIGTLIKAARIYCENVTQRAFVTQTWRMFLDAWPSKPRGKSEPWWDGVREGALSELFESTRDIELHRPPLQSITHIKTYDNDDVATTFNSSNYGVDTISSPGRVYLKSGSVWPTVARPRNGIEIEYVCGYGLAAAVPQDIKHAILMLVAHWYENREAAVSGTITAEQKMAVGMLLRNYMNVRI